MPLIMEQVRYERPGNCAFQSFIKQNRFFSFAFSVAESGVDAGLAHAAGHAIYGNMFISLSSDL
jgi:hypothetical protein